MKLSFVTRNYTVVPNVKWIQTSVAAVTVFRWTNFPFWVIRIWSARLLFKILLFNLPHSPSDLTRKNGKLFLEFLAFPISSIFYSTFAGIAKEKKKKKKNRRKKKKKKKRRKFYSILPLLELKYKIKVNINFLITQIIHLDRVSTYFTIVIIISRKFISIAK